MNLSRLSFLVLPALVILAGAARPAVVDLRASAYGQVSIAALTDPQGNALPGPVSDYIQTSESGSELAQIAFVSVTDAAGADALSPSTLAVDYGNGYAQLGFLDPALFYDGVAYGGIVLITSFLNVSGRSVLADVVLGFDLRALAASTSAFGAGTVRADALAEGVVQRPGAFRASESASAQASVSGAGTQTETLSRSTHYPVLLEAGDRMLWVLSLDSRVAGTLAPVPVPLPGVLAATGLAALAGLGRRRRRA